VDERGEQVARRPSGARPACPDSDFGGGAIGEDRLGALEDCGAAAYLVGGAASEDPVGDEPLVGEVRERASDDVRLCSAVSTLMTTWPPG
jgi:hypothetical protein